MQQQKLSKSNKHSNYMISVYFQVEDGIRYLTVTGVQTCALPILIWWFGELTRFQRQSLWLALSSFIVLLLLLVVLSIAFDFGHCVYPSREHPYFTSGRLL